MRLADCPQEWNWWVFGPDVFATRTRSAWQRLPGAWNSWERLLASWRGQPPSAIWIARQPAWIQRLPEIFDEDILTIEDDDKSENEDIIDKDKKIDEEKVFYVKVDDEAEEFIGKIYKLFDDGEWRSKLVDGISETFDKLNYDPDWDEIDIIAFLRENYADAEIIDEPEFNDHVTNESLRNRNREFESGYSEGYLWGENRSLKDKHEIVKEIISRGVAVRTQWSIGFMKGAADAGNGIDRKYVNETKLVPNLGGKIDPKTHKMLKRNQNKNDNELTNLEKEITESSTHNFKESEFIREVNDLEGEYDPKNYYTCKNGHGDEVRIVGIDIDKDLVGLYYYDDYEWQLSYWDKTGENQQGQASMVDIRPDYAQEAYTKFTNNESYMNRNYNPKYPFQGDKYITKKPWNIATGTHTRNERGTGEYHFNVGDIAIFDRSNDWDQSYWVAPTGVIGRIYSLPEHMVADGRIEMINANESIKHHSIPTLEDFLTEKEETPEQMKKRWDKESRAYELKNEKFRLMPEKEFEIYARERWEKYQKRIKHNDDSIPFWEFYSELCDSYGRKPKYN